MGKKDNLTDEDKDLLDLLDDEDLDSDNDQQIDTAELKQLVEDLKKENQGLLQAKQEEKRKRQEHQGRLERIESAVEQMVNNRNTTSKQVDDTIREAKKGGIPVEFTEDGEAFIPTEYLNEWSKPYQRRMQELTEALNSTRQEAVANQEADKLIRDILSEDERYNSVYSQYKKAREWVNEQVIDYQRDNQLSGYMTSGQALDSVFDSTLENQFKEKFPGMDLDSVVLAEDSGRLFRKMLQTNLNEDKPASKQDDDKERFKKVLKKPAGLGDSQNAKDDKNLDVAARIEDMSQEDWDSLSDKQVDELLKLVGEEQRGR